MQWYYAVNNQRQGPVTQAEFDKLVSDGVITGDTLVWRQGMTEWQPYAKVAGASGGVPPVAPATAASVATEATDDTAICAASGKRYPKREMIQYEGKWISAEHRDAYFQRMREGVVQPGDGAVPGPFGYGGFWRRFVARIVDGIIQSVVLMPLSLLLGFGIFNSARVQSGDLTGMIMLQVVFQLVGIVVGLAYEIFFIRKFDATPGKMAMGLKILRPDGSKLSIGRIVGRYFGAFVSGMILAIGYIMAAFDDEKRSLHDRIADTRVIKTR
ncbi:MAG: RDD family protein [Opitutaceae bacterium]